MDLASKNKSPREGAFFVLDFFLKKLYIIVMIRTICKADKRQITLPIPEDYMGSTIEILLFPIEEQHKVSIPNTEKQTGFGCLKGQIWMSDDFDAPSISC